MKPKPLKGKTIADIPKDYHYDKDIRSAVEWLKKELMKGMKPGKGKITFEYCFIGDKIDKAFEDVIK